ncbi:hypothetical protein [Croceicoccus sp. Ery5]|uniref:hypothetical protein n=1 Tax=Croceicoccus sp. Ery5 TaxID=1703340 RepID=UPI001E49CB05|nr:hypothetical protein [Croceicoccus sp. Ery5]
MSIHQFSNSAVPLPRDQLEAMMETITAMQRVTGAMAVALLASLDRIDGDPDEETNAVGDDFTPMPSEIDFGPGCEIADAPEANGDERDGSMGEDDFCVHNTGGDYGAGCPVADPGGCEHDGREPDDGY